MDVQKYPGFGFRFDYLERLKVFEGFRSKAYKPKHENSLYYTVGYGHYGVTADTVVTREEAHEILLSDLCVVEDQLKRLIKDWQDIPVNKWTVLVDFVFNVGITKFRRSTFYRIMSRNLFDSRLHYELGRWIYAGGVILPGLENRCQYRQYLWSLGSFNHYDD